MDAEVFELIAESAAELEELVAFIASAGLELVAVVAIARPIGPMPCGPIASAA